MADKNILDSMGDIIKGGWGVTKAGAGMAAAPVMDAAKNAVLAPAKAAGWGVGAMTGLEAPPVNLGMENTRKAGAAFFEPRQQMMQGLRDIAVNQFGFREPGYGRGVAKMLPTSTTAPATPDNPGTAAQPAEATAVLSDRANAGKGTGGFTGKVLGPTGSNTISVSGEDGSRRLIDVPQGGYGVGGGGSPDMSPIDYQKSIGMGVDSINRFDPQFQDLITSMVDKINARANASTGDETRDQWLRASIPKALENVARLLGPMTSQGQYGISQNQLEETSRHNKATEDIEGPYKQALARGIETKIPAEVANLTADANYKNTLASVGKANTLENTQVKDWETGFNKYLNDTVLPGLAGGKPEEQKAAIRQARSLYTLANPHPLTNKVADVKQNQDGTATVTFGDGRQTIMKKRATGGGA